jgi:hypothetical protein
MSRTPGVNEAAQRRFLNLHNALNQELGIDPNRRLTDISPILTELWTPIVACVPPEHREEILTQMTMIHEWYVRQSAKAGAASAKSTYAAGLALGRDIKRNQQPWRRWLGLIITR